MTCDDCQPWLIDLVSGELDPARAEEVRAHARECPRCGADLRVLEEGLLAADALPRLAPPPEVRTAVLAEARRQAQAHAGRGTTPTTATRDERGGWFSRLAELCMSPQVAMVAVLLLMISVGLYYLPGPEPESAGLSPLRVQDEPLPEDGRDQAASATAIGLADDDAPEEAAAEPEAPAQAAPATEPEAERADELRARAPGARSLEEGQAKGAPKAPRRRARAEKKKSATSAPLEPLMGGGSFAPPPPAAKPAVPQPQKREAANADSLGTQSAGRGAAVASGAPVEEAAETDAELAADEATSPLEQARQAQAEGRHLEAARLAEAALAGGADALAAHTIAAVSYRRAGSCAKAAPHYRALRKLRGELPPQWPEAVRCFDALGRDAEVDAWLAEAERRQPAAARRLRESLRSGRSSGQSAPAALEAQ